MNQGESAPEGSTPLDPEAGSDEVELLARIEHTRQELGETVEQLATKADVKAQARAAAVKVSTKVKSTTGQLGQRAVAWAAADSNRQVIVPAVVAVAAAIAATWLLLAGRKGR
jgi:hypothetical protein